MHLTRYSDYSFRVLIYLGLAQGQRCTIKEISEHYRISRNHLVKVVHRLGTLGYIRTIRGKKGGIMLARAPDELNLGEVARRTEDNLALVECFNPATNACCITPACRLRDVLSEALQAFLAVLDRYTLADLLQRPDELRELLRMSAAQETPPA
ncbi:MAG TPA: Rrf2 family transcriptional regulator [Gammaproteobacteria bacterium]|nr:Rrf2 family transcriptional regulator [Gammaproteobacteria bacterium]